MIEDGRSDQPIQVVGNLEEPHYWGDAGYDLTCDEEVTLFPGDFADVDCGVSVALPDGTWGLITGRSSTFRDRRLHVVQGVIDNGYRGPLKVGVVNQGIKAVRVEAGDQLAQLILMPLIRAELWQVSSLPGGSRGLNSMGSTSS